MAHARLRNSRLVGPPLTTPEDVVAWLGAVQSQDVPGALWGIAQRMPRDAGLTIDDLGAAMDAGRFIRTHGPRPTWHFLSPPDLRWILALVGPRVQAQNGSINRREGVDEATLRRVGGGRRAAASRAVGYVISRVHTAPTVHVAELRWRCGPG